MFMVLTLSSKVYIGSNNDGYIEVWTWYTGQTMMGSLNDGRKLLILLWVVEVVEVNWSYHDG